MSNTTCPICGHEFPIEREGIYTAREPQGVFTALSTGSKQFDAVDCPQCGCQKRLADRFERVEAEPDTTPSGLNELAREIHENAKAHGWYDPAPSFLEVIATFHSELSEALEEYREGKPPLYFDCCEADAHPCLPSDKTDCLNFGNESACNYRGRKPRGLAVELADAIMRILDTCAYMDIDIERVITLKHEYNKTREYRHGGKKI